MEANLTTRRTLLAAASAIVTAPSFAQAQAWAPTWSVRLAIAYPPGGATDLVARWAARGSRCALANPRW